MDVHFCTVEILVLLPCFPHSLVHRIGHKWNHAKMNGWKLCAYKQCGNRMPFTAEWSLSNKMKKDEADKKLVRTVRVLVCMLIQSSDLHWSYNSTYFRELRHSVWLFLLFLPCNNAVTINNYEHFNIKVFLVNLPTWMG